MAANEAEKTGSAAAWECPNPRGKPYGLWELVALLKQDRTFARFFFEQLKSADANHQDAIDCVNSYLAPTTQELQELGIPASEIDNMRKCTDSGLLVAVTAKENS